MQIAGGGLGPITGVTAFLRDPVILAALAATFSIRLYIALTTSHIWDEDRDWAVTAEMISFDPNATYLPIRSFNHGALPAYFIKLGTFLFGETPLGFRIMSVVVGTATVAVVALTANYWLGRTAAIWSAAFVGFNEFHTMVSAIATDKVYSIFFGALALYFFARALKDDRPVWLMAAAIPAALSILSYEIMYLQVPIFAIALLLAGKRAWFADIRLYGAALLGLLILLPDLLWNLSTSGDSTMSYAAHLERAGGFGFNRHYFLFFFRDVIAAVYALFDKTVYDGFSEYATMNALLGVILFGAVLYWTWRFATESAVRRNPMIALLLTAFWVIFLTFTFMKPGAGDRLDAVGWPWVQFTLIPSALLAGALFAQFAGRWRQALVAVSVIGISYGLVQSAWTKFNIPRYSIAILPNERISGGELATFDVDFHGCHVCDPSPSRELIAIQGRAIGGATYPAAEEDVVGETINSSDSTFALRSLSLRGYVVEYVVVDENGNKERHLPEVWPSFAHTEPYWWDERDRNDNGGEPSSFLSRVRPA